MHTEHLLRAVRYCTVVGSLLVAQPTLGWTQAEPPMPSADDMMAIASLGTLTIGAVGYLESQEQYTIDGNDAPEPDAMPGGGLELRVMIGRQFAISGLLAVAFGVDKDQVVQDPTRLEALGEWFPVSSGRVALGLGAGIGWTSRSLNPSPSQQLANISQWNVLGNAAVYVSLAKWLVVYGGGRLGVPIAVTLDQPLDTFLPYATSVTVGGTFKRLQGGLVLVF